MILPKKLVYAASREVFSCRILKRRQSVFFLFLLWTSSLASFMLGISSFGQRFVKVFAYSDISIVHVGDERPITTGDTGVSPSTAVPQTPPLREALSSDTSRVQGTFCDSECQQFRLLLDTWPPDKPKAAIYFLIQKSSLTLLRKSLKALDKYFNSKFNYPIIMFYEKDLIEKSDHELIRSMTDSRVFMQLVEFEVPSFLEKPVPPVIQGKNRAYYVGYRHMCRFHAKLIYEQPIIAGLEYAWRLDHDSFITRPINYDIFDFMKERKLVYGFVKVYRELPMWVAGLWNTSKKYISSNNISTTFFKKWPQNLMYYNNFEVSKMSFWLSPEYKKFIDHIDKTGGIYYHRWGDAPIKSIAVAMFVPRDKTHNFKDVGYIHQFFRRP